MHQIPLPTVLHEDNHTIAVYKPSGIPIQPDQTDDLSLYDMVKNYLRHTYQKPGDAFVGIVQRLDRPVSGIVLFAKTSKGASRLCEQIRLRHISKRYQAIVLGHPRPLSATLRHTLLRSAGETRVAAQGKPASLHYTTLATNQTHSLLDIELHTGRKHQIRCQLAAIGHPIDGDLRYGAPRPRADRAIALCAWQITFTHPTTKLSISITLPKEFQLQLPQSTPVSNRWNRDNFTENKNRQK